MAKKGRAQAEWVKETKEDNHGSGISRTTYALRADGKAIIKDAVKSEYGWHDWGWRLCGHKAQTLAAAGLEAMNEALLKAGYKRRV